MFEVRQHRIIIFNPKADAHFVRRFSGYGNSLGLNISVFTESRFLENLLVEDLNTYSSTALIFPQSAFLLMGGFCDLFQKKPTHFIMTYADTEVTAHRSQIESNPYHWYCSSSPFQSSHSLDFIGCLIAQPTSIIVEEKIGWGSYCRPFDSNSLDFSTLLHRFATEFKIHSNVFFFGYMDLTKKLLSKISTPTTIQGTILFDGEVLSINYSIEVDCLNLHEIAEVFEGQTFGLVSISKTDGPASLLHMTTKIYPNQGDATQRTGMTLVRFLTEEGDLLRVLEKTG